MAERDFIKIAEGVDALHLGRLDMNNVEFRQLVEMIRQGKNFEAIHIAYQFGVAQGIKYQKAQAEKK